MPILKNSKHERFAQALASGLSASEAYAAAGYSESRGNASRLNSNESIRARVEEILRETATDIQFELKDALQWHLQVLNTPIAEIDENHPLAQEVTRTETKGAITTKVKMPAKMDAIKEIAKLLGWYAPEKQEHDGKVEIIIRKL